MSTQDVQIDLPKIFPRSRIIVEEEKFFLTNQGKFGDTLEQREYELNKAPAIEVKSVVGFYEGEETIFTKSKGWDTLDWDQFDWGPTGDYIVIEGGDAIRFLAGERSPDPDTKFTITYECRSVIDRYAEANEEELQDIENSLQEVRRSRYIQNAENEDLDEIGKIFGEIGERGGRDEDEYRDYLSSIVQSFISRGKQSDIKTAVAAALGIDASEVSINEDLQFNTYEVEVPPISAHKGSIVEQAAELSDPSGVGLDKVRYQIGDTLLADDSVDATSAGNTGDEVGFGDSVSVTEYNTYWNSDDWGALRWADDNN